MPEGKISIHRQVIEKFPDWSSCTQVIGNLTVHSEGVIEDAKGCLQSDFANKFIGGGVLVGGCVQEEIRFAVNPELIATCLLSAVMKDNEVLIMKGSEQFSKYAGYGPTLKYDGDFKDDTKSEDGFLQTEIVGMDAIKYSNRESQFEHSWILRDINKAYVAFYLPENSKNVPVATGNWGCGVFNGDKPLKVTLQLMAAAVANRELIYYTFNDKPLAERIKTYHQFLVTKKITVGQLWSKIMEFDPLEKQSLLDFIEQHDKKCIVQ